MAKKKRKAREVVAEAESQVERVEPEESYGWEYHKVPLLIAVTLSAIFYLLIWVFIK